MRTWKFYCQKLEAQTTAFHLVAWTWLLRRTGERSAAMRSHEIRFDIATQETGGGES
jgi:hypothetical protein